MSLRRLLGLSSAAAAVSGRLRSSLATAATHPPWAIIKRSSLAAPDGLASVRLCHPPHVSEVAAPMHLLQTGGSPDPETCVVQLFPGSVCAASGDGLLLLSHFELRMSIPILANFGKKPAKLDPDCAPESHFVCNPVTGELSRLPDVVSDRVKGVMCGTHMGLLTRAGRGHAHDGPPDRFAIAERQMVLDQEVVAFGGRLWWLDATCGAISADPFSDRPELCFVELPRDSVLSAPAQDDRCGCGRPRRGCGTSMHRRLCASEGRLRYVELSPSSPFLLSTFALDDEGSGWTLERRRDLSRFQGCDPQLLQVGFLDPLNADLMYVSAPITTPQDTPRSSVVLLVDMTRDDVFLSHQCICADPSLVLSVLPTWLGSSQIPSADQKYVKKNKTLADVLVRADSP